VKQLEINLSASFSEDIKAEGEWDQLLVNSSQNSVFLSEGWLTAWSETIGADEKLILAKVRSEGTLVAAAAFQESGGIVGFAGKGPSDYSDFIVSTELSNTTATTAIALILSAVRTNQRRFKSFFLGRIPTESSTLDHLSRIRNGLYATICRGTVAPSMAMAAADEKLKKKSLRRHERSLMRQGKVSDLTYTRAADILPLLDTFFEQHISRWQHTDSPSLFLSQDNREFYRRFIRNLDHTGWLRFTILKLDDQIVATHCGFLSGDRYTWYKPTFDTGLKKLSPGEVLIKRLIERAKMENAAEFDFTIGDEAFKHRFATKIRQVVYAHVTDSWPRAAIRRVRVFLGKKISVGTANGGKQ
jgi:CelD/BcsL family acetyltransferase involved in cellulose biosynthesis